MGIQNTLVYRVNFFFRAFFNLVPLFATMSLWQAIYAGKSVEIAGYSLAQMLSYYLLVTIVEACTSVTEDDWQIAADISHPVRVLPDQRCAFALESNITVAAVPI